MKISLREMRKLDIFEEIEPPKVVYHMTSRENAEKIIADQRVKCFDDFVTFFFPSTYQIPIYIYVTNADVGREHADPHGRTVVEPPLNHEDTVVLKLICRNEPLAWYREVINSSKEDYSDMTDLEDKLWHYMNEARICHYGDLRFRKVNEVIPLTEIDKMPEPKEIAEIKDIQAAMEKERQQKL